MKHLNTILALLFLLASTIVSAQALSVDATIDTSKLRIGEQAKIDLYLNYAAKADIKVQWPTFGDTITEKVEVISVTPIDTTFPDKTNSTRLLQHQQITISVYDSGYYVIPGFKFIVNNDTANPVFTKPLFVEVHTVPTDTSAAKTKDIKPPLEEPFNWKWYINYIYGGIAAIIAITAIIIVSYYLGRRKKQVIEEPSKPKVPAHLTALAMLERIRQEAVWKEGRIKEYYSAISDTIRTYIEERFHVFALESTTDEIMSAFRSQVVDQESKEKLQQILSLSDLVKFAKLSPIENEHEFTLQNAVDFVNATKREEEVDPSVYEMATQAAADKKDDIYAQAQREIPKAVQITTQDKTRTAVPRDITDDPETKRKRKRMFLIVAVAAILLLLAVSYGLTRLLQNGIPLSDPPKLEQGNPATGTQPMSYEDYLARMVDQVKGQLPMMIDQETRLDNISFRGKTLEYRCTLVNIAEGQVDTDMIEGTVRNALLQEVKSNPLFAQMRSNSGSLEATLCDRYGKVLFLITISPEDYLN